MGVGTPLLVAVPRAISDMRCWLRRVVAATFAFKWRRLRSDDRNNMLITLLVDSKVDCDVGWLTEWSRSAAPRLHPRLCSDCKLVTELEDCLANAEGVVLVPGDVWSDALASVVLEHRARVVLVDLNDADRQDSLSDPDPGLAVIRGRGLDGIRWATQWLVGRLSHPFDTVSYGPTRDHVADIRGALADRGRSPAVVLLHGGFWRERWTRDTIEPLAIDLARRGYVSWNVEYRRVGPSGGGWPDTCVDVAAALDAVCAHESVDPERLVVVGHSAGAQLACWSVHCRGVARAQSVTPALIVSLAGVLDMSACARRGLGDTGNAAVAFMGSEPEAAPEDYRCASPISCLPLSVPQVVAQGLGDSLDLVEMSASYARSARRMGEQVVHLEFAEADHFTVIDPSSSAWNRIAAKIESIVPPEVVEPHAPADVQGPDRSSGGSRSPAPKRDVENDGW